MLPRGREGVQTAVRALKKVVAPGQSGGDDRPVDPAGRSLGSGGTEHAGESGLQIRPGAKALVSDGDRFLLIEERRSDGSPFWTLPGGGIRPDESAEAALRRELAEELQCRSRVDAAMATFSYRHTSRPQTVSVYTVFGATLQSRPRPNRDEGVLGCQWTQLTRLPETTLPQVCRILHRTAVDLNTLDQSPGIVTSEEPTG